MDFLGLSAGHRRHLDLVDTQCFVFLLHLHAPAEIHVDRAVASLAEACADF